MRVYEQTDEKTGQVEDMVGWSDMPVPVHQILQVQEKSIYRAL